MNEKMTELLKTMETVPAPEGVKQRVLSQVLLAPVRLNRFERLVFTNPLRAAGIISVCVTATLWAVLGNNFSVVLTSLF